MGQINLFAPKLTDNMRDFITGYQEGKLWKVMLSRVIDERDIPHAFVIDDDVEHNYILIEYNQPLIHADINWLYLSLVANDTEIDKKAMFRYAIERVLNPTEPANKKLMRRKVTTDAEWEQVKEFRRLLEAPAMAFRHFRRSYRDKSKHLAVTRTGSVLVIEYTGTNDEYGRELTRVQETDDASVQ